MSRFLIREIWGGQGSEQKEKRNSQKKVSRREEIDRLTGEQITQVHHVDRKGNNKGVRGDLLRQEGVGIVHHALEHWSEWLKTGNTDELDAAMGQVGNMTVQERQLFERMRGDEGIMKKVGAMATRTIFH